MVHPASDNVFSEKPLQTSLNSLDYDYINPITPQIGLPKSSTTEQAKSSIKVCTVSL